MSRIEWAHVLTLIPLLAWLALADEGNGGIATSPLLMAGLAALTGLWLWNGAWGLGQALAQRRWPVARGVVTASWIEAETDGHGYRYWTTSAYRYVVHGAVYHGQSRDQALGSTQSQATCRTRSVGSVVTVRYSPADPARAVLAGSPSLFTGEGETG